MNNNNETEDIEYLDIDLDESETEFMVDSSTIIQKRLRNIMLRRKGILLKKYSLML